MPYLMEKIFDSGALDVYWTPVQMKKTRPGIMLEIISPREKLHDIIETVLKESTSIGVRFHYVARITLDRKIREIETEWGTVRVKISYLGQTVYNRTPEYEDCAQIARDNNVPLKDIYHAIVRLAADIEMRSPAPGCPKDIEQYTNLYLLGFYHT